MERSDEAPEALEAPHYGPDLQGLRRTISGLHSDLLELRAWILALEMYQQGAGRSSGYRH